jgi:C4-dicarboxylate-specific signal transduction histidine kinase
MNESTRTAPVGEPADVSANGLVRRLARRYLFVLAAVALLVVVDQSLIQPLLARLNSYAPIMNVAGRQRMLSQKLTKAALALGATHDPVVRRQRREELQSTLADWSAAHAALAGGDDQLGVTKIDTAQMLDQWALLEPHFRKMTSAAEALVGRTPKIGDAEGPGPDTGALNSAALDDDDATARDIAVIVDHETAYLTAMDRVVRLLEAEAGRAAGRLRACALIIACAVIGLLVGLGLLVVRPATRAIRAQVGNLERRVTHRTAELAAANLALRHEIVDRQRAESKTQHLAAQLAHAARVSTLGHLTVGLAHEINQPLAAIANYAETCDVLLLQGPVDRPLLQQHIDQVRTAALRAGQIVRRMRNFVRPQANSAVTVDLHELVREVAELCRAELERANVQLSLDFSADDATVSIDPIQIQQVLVNLIRNAIQAMQTCPDKNRRLTIRTRSDERTIQVAVADCGPGIPVNLYESLFVPFQTTKADGLGIGLAICRSILEQHQGSIRAEAPSSQGATFLFLLPRCLRHDADNPKQADCLCR